MSDRITLYLRADNRAWVAVAPAGTSLPDSLSANTIQYTVSQDDWAAYDATRQALAAGLDLVVNSDGSTSSVARTPSHQQNVEVILRTFAAMASPTTTDLTVALKALAGLVTGSYGWGASAWGGGVWGAGAP